MSRIIMIGNAFSGKTSNMLCTYGILKKALHTHPVFDKCEVCLEENVELDADYRNYKETSDIQATSRIRDYGFRLMAKGIIRRAEVQSYDLTDTIGGFCVADTETYDYKYISHEMSDADHILMFFSCQELLPRDDKESAASGKNLDRLLEHLNERLSSNYGHKIHLILVFTYYDTIEEGGWEEKEILSLFDGLINTKRTDLEVSHFFVSNLPKRMDNVELPILSVLTHLAYEDLMAERRSVMKRNSLSHRTRTKATINLCRYLQDKTGNWDWLMMADDLK